MHLLFLATVAQAAVLVPFTKSMFTFSKRSVGGWLQGNGLSYLVTFELGGQTIDAQIDTGSSDIWVVSTDGCDGGICGTAYDPNNSTSYTANQTEFSISYSDETGASGHYASDDLKIDGNIVKNANFALATKANTANIFGIGPKWSESCTKWKEVNGNPQMDTEKGCTPYDNLPVQMKNQGIIKATAYSIWLEKAIEGKGRLLFGGVNHAAIAGPFYKVPLEQSAWKINDDGTYTSFPEYTMANILMNELSMTRYGHTTNLYKGAFPVLLDYGSTVCSFPSSITRAIAKEFGLEGNNFDVPCNKPYEGWLTLNFRGVIIRVSMSDFIRRKYDDNNRQMDQCSLGMIENDDMNLMILGDNVLSSIYVTLDYDNNEVGLGQAALFSIDNIVDIEGELDAIKAPQYDETFLYKKAAIATSSSAETSSSA